MTGMLIAGVDEVGRGPIAGDTYAAAVILPERYDLPGLTDSKALTPKKRQNLYPQICRQATAWSVASASVEEIDRLGILQAVVLAMRRAVENLSVVPERILVDGNLAPDMGKIPVTAIVRGDLTEPCISAASILAKVTRDLYMTEMDKLYPGYHFAKNKGYGSAAHAEAVREMGRCPIHRASFKFKGL